MGKEINEKNKRKLIESLRKTLGEGKRLGLREPAKEDTERIQEEVWEELYN